MSNYRTTSKDLYKLSKQELVDEVKRLQFTISSRGCRIGALYSVIQGLMEESSRSVHVIVPPHDMSLIDSLKQQLDSSREALLKIMKEKGSLSKEEESSLESKEEQEINVKKRDMLSRTDCVLCYESFDDQEKRPVCLSCGHIYCERCILKYQDKKTVATCPLCRSPFTSFIPLFLN
jgi:Zinc finger, C3HC4 type (RING finger)